MKRKMLLFTALSAALTCASAALYAFCGIGAFLTLSITFGTCLYHLAMRLAVGYAFNLFMKNRADCTKNHYRIRKWEKAVYKRLRVKHWKLKMPTFDETLFDVNTRTAGEIVMAGCQAECVHETAELLSFLPVFAGIFFGAYPVFIITSVLAAMCDAVFVIIQRYNRPRLMRLAARESGRLSQTEKEC